jgi:hypothetical protein
LPAFEPVVRLPFGVLHVTKDHCCADCNWDYVSM